MGMEWGPSPIPEQGRFAFAYLPGILVTLPVKFQKYAVDVAHFCDVNAAPTFREDTPFPFVGSGFPCSVEDLCKMLQRYEERYGLSRFDPAFSCFGEWGQLPLAPFRSADGSDAPGVHRHPFLDRYNVGWVCKKGSALEAALVAALSVASPDGRSCLVSLDLRVRNITYPYLPYHASRPLCCLFLVLTWVTFHFLLFLVPCKISDRAWWARHAPLPLQRQP